MFYEDHKQKLDEICKKLDEIDEIDAIIISQSNYYNAHKII